MIITVAEACGAGFHRAGGRCVRNAAGGRAVVVKPRPVARPPVVVSPRVVVRPAVVRPWARRSYFGTVVAGVALGTLIAVTAAPPPPAENLCWYWTTPAPEPGLLGLLPISGTRKPRRAGLLTPSRHTDEITHAAERDAADVAGSVGRPQRLGLRQHPCLVASLS
jgi:hypothetical protein